MQLPHFDEEVISRLKKRRVELKIQGKNGIYEFIRLKPEVIEELDLFAGDECKEFKTKDLLACVEHIPRVECSVNIFTEVEKLNADGSSGGTVREYKPYASDYIKV